MNNTVVDSGDGKPDMHELGYPAIGIPDEFLAHEAELLQEAVFEQNWESKPVRVIEGLLATAADYPGSDIAVHMRSELGLIQIHGTRSLKVIVALEGFAQEQAKQTGDSAWTEVSETLRNHVRDCTADAADGDIDKAISEAVLEYMTSLSR